jgi:hypothetical protein
VPVLRQNLSLHMSLSPLPSSLSPWLFMLRRTPSSVHLRLGLTYFPIPCSSHSRVLRGNLFCGMLFTCSNHRNRLCSVTSNIIFPTSIIARMVPFGNCSFLDFHAGLLQKAISVASSLLAFCVFRVHVCAPYSGMLWTKAFKYVVLVY